MNLLLDTHILIWLTEGSSRLSPRAKQVIEDENNQLSLSIASLWELTIKVSLGKLQLEIPIEQILEQFILPSGIEILPIQVEHLLGLRNLPLHHRDPFDRLLIAQAQAESLTLISSDNTFQGYEVEILW